MTVEEARKILGISAETPAKEVRKAYLRQVKGHPPERDPEGFQRVREAFELLSAREVPLSFVAFPVPDRPAGAEHETQAEELRGAPPEPEPWIAPTREDSIVAQVTQRLEELPGEVADAHFEVIATAVEEHPDRPQLFWLWVELLEDAGRFDEIPDVLRWGGEQGHPGFFESLVVRAPGSLDAKELGRAAGSQDPRLALAAARELVRRGEPDSVVTIALDALRAWLRRFPESPPPVGRALEVFFELQIAGRLASSRDLLRGIEEVVEDLGIGLQDRRAVAWLIAAQELQKLSGDFPRGLRSKLAESTLVEDREIAADAMHEFALNFPSTAPEVATQLRRAPHLYGFYGHLLAGRQSSFYAPSPLGFGVGGILLFLLFQVLSRDVGSHDYLPPQGYPPLAAGDWSIQAELRPEVRFPYRVAASQIQRACGSSRDSSIEVCRMGFELLDAAREAAVDCVSLTATYGEILAWNPDAPPSNPFASGEEETDPVQWLVDVLCSSGSTVASQESKERTESP